MNAMGQCRVCGGMFRLTDDGSFMRAHGKQRYRCRGWKRAPVDTSVVRQNAINKFSLGKV